MPRKLTKKELTKSPKGMRDIMGDEYYRYQGFFEKAQEIAVYYGFKPIETPVLEKGSLFSRSIGEGTDIVEKEMYSLKTSGGDKLVLRPEGTASVMRAYMEHGMHALPQPIMLYYYGPMFRHENPQRGRYREHKQFGFEILGTAKSIADAMIIRAIVDTLEEVGFKNLSININSIGDNECRPGYIRALTTYYKKHIDEICVHCKNRLRTNPMRILDCKSEKCQPLKEQAPDALDYLCAGCKQHFKEVLEYLDGMDIHYQINTTLVRGLDYYTRTVFEIIEHIPSEGDENKDDNSGNFLAIAAGGRYDNLSKSLGNRKPVCAAGGSIGVDRVVNLPKLKVPNPRIIKKPKVYFIQLGFEAKIKSLNIIEALRKARIPIVQTLSKDSLSAQLATAEKLNIPYTVIFGQKEAIDGTAIVRNMESRSQKTIPLEKLAEYLKKIK